MLNKENVVLFNKPFQHLIVDLELFFKFKDIFRIFSSMHDTSLKRNNENFQKIENRKTDLSKGDIVGDVK